MQNPNDAKVRHQISLLLHATKKSLLNGSEFLPVREKDRDFQIQFLELQLRTGDLADATGLVSGAGIANFC